jgi:hypothetical protein
MIAVLRLLEDVNGLRRTVRGYTYIIEFLCSARVLSLGARRGGGEVVDRASHQNRPHNQLFKSHAEIMAWALYLESDLGYSNILHKSTKVS